jgi:plasmid stabilization system protein ParE
LRDFPDLGVSRDDIRSGMRMLIEGNYLVLYEHRKSETMVEIVSVIDGRRNLDNWL